MVTNDTGLKEGVLMSLKGLSTDTKPTDTFNGQKIANGSSFFEIDTQDVKFYDAENDVWV